MGEIRAIGLFAFSCLIAATTEALPLWLIIFALASIALKFWRNVRLPPVLLYSMIVLAFSYLVWDAPKVWHRSTASAAFVIATLFYVLSPAHRHRIMRFHAGLFSLLVSVLIVPKETYPLPVYLILTLLVCVSLIAHHTSLNNSLALFSLGKTIGKLALPLSLLMVPLYYFFPDIEAPRQRTQTSGIANELEPGRISSLALSDRLAFRVKFPGAVPKLSELYWRTDVFEEGNGLRWTRGSQEIPETFGKDFRDSGLVYELMLDDQLDGLVPTLEHTSSLVSYENIDITFKKKARVVRSSAGYIHGLAQLGDSFPAEKPQLIPLDRSTPRVMKQVEELKTLSAPDQIARVLQLFQTFHYTLNPGKLTQDDRLDEFLFETQKGYCEHFAASFASLLRLAGTPARVVVGYRGGVRLGQTSYFQVTNVSAHAWAEVWYDGAWHRIDPASVALGGETIGQGSANMFSLLITWFSFQAEDFMVWLKEWAEDIGLIWIGFGVLGVGLLSLQIYRVTHRKVELPLYEKRTRKLIRTLEEKGYVRAQGETVAQYFARIDKGLETLAKIYNERKFGENKELDESLFHELRAAFSQAKRLPRSPSPTKT